MPSTKTYVDKISTVVIPVADQQRLVDFYVEQLGLEKRVDVEFGNGYHWIEVGAPDAVTTIALAPPPPDGPRCNVCWIAPPFCSHSNRLEEPTRPCKWPRITRWNVSRSADRSDRFRRSSTS